MPGPNCNAPVTFCACVAGFVDADNDLYVFGDNSSYQNGNLIPDSVMPIMFSPQKVPYVHTAIRGNCTAGSYALSDVPASFANIVEKGLNINAVFKNAIITTSGLKTSIGQKPVTTFTVNSVDGINVNMWIQTGAPGQLGIGQQLGRILEINTDTRNITVEGHYDIVANTPISFEIFNKETRITDVSLTSNGNLLVSISGPAAISLSDITFRIFYAMKPSKVTATRDALAVLDLSGRLSYWGNDRGFGGCSAIGSNRKYPWIISYQSRNFYDLSYGFDHLVLLRKLRVDN